MLLEEIVKNKKHFLVLNNSRTIHSKSNRHVNWLAMFHWQFLLHGLEHRIEFVSNNLIPMPLDKWRQTTKRQKQYIRSDGICRLWNRREREERNITDGSIMFMGEEITLFLFSSLRLFTFESESISTRRVNNCVTFQSHCHKIRLFNSSNINNTLHCFRHWPKDNRYLILHIIWCCQRSL